MTSATTPDDTTGLLRKLRLLVIFTITYNLVESVVSLTAGHAAGSSALIGFGLDSLIEVSSATAVVVQFSMADPQRYERRTLRAIGLSFFALAAFVGYRAVGDLLGRHAADTSTVGITIAATSLIVMPAVSLTQRRIGRQMGSATAVADAQQTLMCAYLSAALLVGLVANSRLGWWWADPVAALGIAAMALREGREAWNGDACCAPSTELWADPALATCDCTDC